MLRLYKYESFGYSAFPEALLHLGRDVDEGPARRNAEPEFLSV
jgi:hypothetical protein